jgi:hypothetical protein
MGELECREPITTGGDPCNLRDAARFPKEAMHILRGAADGETSNSGPCRYLLSSLIGKTNPAGHGRNLLKLRYLDRTFSDAFLELFNWVRDATTTKEALWLLAQEIESEIKHWKF